MILRFPVYYRGRTHSFFGGQSIPKFTRAIRQHETDLSENALRTLHFEDGSDACTL